MISSVVMAMISAWRRLSAAGSLDDRRAELARADLAAFAMERVGHTPLIDRCWALRAKLAIYDAVYVALAEALAATLLTADVRLANAPGARCEIEVLA